MLNSKEKDPNPIGFLEVPCRERARYRRMRKTHPLPKYSQITFLPFVLKGAVK